MVKKGRKIFKKKEDSLKKTAKKKMKKNITTRKTPASTKKTVALKSAAWEELEDLERLEDNGRKLEMRMKNLQQCSITPSFKIGRKLFENFENLNETSTLNIEGASPPPDNGQTYGLRKLRSESVVQTGRKPICEKAKQKDVIGSRWVPQMGGGTHPCTCLLYTSPSPRDVEESRMPSSA